MKLTQKRFILAELLKNNSISRNFCLKNYITRLGSFMCQFKSEGLEFITDRRLVKKHSWTGIDYVYVLKGGQKKIIKRLIK